MVAAIKPPARPWRSETMAQVRRHSDDLSRRATVAHFADASDAVASHGPPHTQTVFAHASDGERSEIKHQKLKILRAGPSIEAKC